VYLDQAYWTILRSTWSETRSTRSAVVVH